MSRTGLASHILLMVDNDPQSVRPWQPVVNGKGFEIIVADGAMRVFMHLNQ
jgi:hypothetical protein